MAKANSISLRLHPYAILATHAKARGISKRQLIEELMAEYEPFGTRKVGDPSSAPQTLAESCLQGIGVSPSGHMSDTEIEAALRAENKTPQQVARVTCDELNEALAAWQAKQGSKPKVVKPKAAVMPKPTPQPEPEMKARAPRREPEPREPVRKPRPTGVGLRAPTPALQNNPHEEPGKPPVTGAGYGVF